MPYLKKYCFLFLEIIFFVFVFLTSKPTGWDLDVWFHVKSGEIIAQRGIINYDVFSYVTAGREWFSYEWLFQYLIYIFQKVFGFEAIKYLVAGFATLSVFTIYKLTQKVFGATKIAALTIAFFYFVSIFEFINPRPHLLAYLFLIWTLFLILHYYFKGKNLLYLSLPIIILWSNLHGSVFLATGLFLGYGFVSFVNWFRSKDLIWLNKSKIFLIYVPLSVIFSILPPIYFKQYKVLITFYEYRETITKFIDEWTPLNNSPISFAIYTTTFVIVFSIFLLTAWKFKKFGEIFWVLPILPLSFGVYIASRNAFLGYLVFTLILGWCVGQASLKKLGGRSQKLFLIFLVILILSHIGILYSKIQEGAAIRKFEPVHATKFIKNYHLQGHMFNEYGYGGYLLYHLYPEQKVFFDGRTDPYLCCEMPYTLNLALKKNLPDDEYKIVLDEMWKKYDMSFVLVRTEKHIVLRKIARILQNDPNWNLVYWDDVSMIFVRKDGKNDVILEKFGTKAVTPYNKDLFIKGHEQTAFEEYQRMIGIVDSAKSRNAIGYLYLLQKKYPEARAEFEKAILLDKTNESAYMNLAEILAKDGDLEQAIYLYKQAKNLAPDRGLIYIRLGQLILQQTEDLSKAKQVWQEGVLKTVDDEAKSKLNQLMQM